MFKLVLTAALVLACALSARAAESDDVLRIYGPPRNRVRTLTARVARQKEPLPVISAWFDPAERPDEATAQDLQRWLTRQPIPSMRQVDQIPTASPGGPGEIPAYGDIVVR